MVALGSAWWAERRVNLRRPRLSLAFDDDSGLTTESVFAQYRPGEDPVKWKADYLRVEVTNAPGSDAADDVEVLLAEVRRYDLDGREAGVLEISFPGFVWTHTETTRLTVPPGVTRTVDLGRVHSGAPSAVGVGDGFELTVHPQPGDRRNVLVPGSYVLRLILAARNADAVEYSVTVVHDPDVGRDIAVRDLRKETRPTA
jgi:hypothetical protein